jgi:hypothetical protein
MNQLIKILTCAVTMIVSLSFLLSAHAENWEGNEKLDTYSTVTQATELACQRTDRTKVPLGEYCCPIAPDDKLCWKSGPWKKNGWDDMPIPYYFELTEDYAIDLYSFFNDENDPNFTFRQMVLDLWEDFVPWKMENINWDFIDIISGKYGDRLKLKKGYRWDGASRGVDSEWATFLFNLRSAMVHDALYDLLRLEYLPYSNEPWMPIPPLCLWAGINNPNYRRLADNLFKWVAVEDGHDEGLADGARFVLRTQGCLKTNQHSEKNASWRFHTLANAYIEDSGNGDMIVNDDGKKSFVVTCAMKNDLIDLDARSSRPIAVKPQTGKDIPDLHLTSWKWTLNGKDLVPIKQNEIGVFLFPYELMKGMTIGELTEEEEWKPGVNSVVLHITNPSDEDSEYFENSEEIKVTVEFDTEPPIISGISEPITLRSRNHKYMTFAIGDFVSVVTDDCTTLSMDDLMIVSVTSNESDNSRRVGDGNTANDILIAPDRKSVALRMERRGRGGGRTYAINIEADDESDNSTIESYEVEVRHDGKK